MSPDESCCALQHERCPDCGAPIAWDGVAKLSFEVHERGMQFHDCQPARSEDAAEVTGG